MRSARAQFERYWTRNWFNKKIGGKALSYHIHVLFHGRPDYFLQLMVSKFKGEFNLIPAPFSEGDAAPEFKAAAYWEGHPNIVPILKDGTPDLRYPTIPFMCSNYGFHFHPEHPIVDAWEFWMKHQAEHGGFTIMLQPNTEKGVEGGGKVCMDHMPVIFGGRAIWIGNAVNFNSTFFPCERY